MYHCDRSGVVHELIEDSHGNRIKGGIVNARHNGALVHAEKACVSSSAASQRILMVGRNRAHSCATFCGGDNSCIICTWHRRHFAIYLQRHTPCR